MSEHVSYKLAERLKEAGVEQRIEVGDRYYMEGKRKICVHLEVKTLWFEASYAIKAHTPDQLKALIHEWVACRISVASLKQWVAVRIHTNDSADIYKSASTESDALALALLEIIEKEKPRGPLCEGGVCPFITWCGKEEPEPDGCMLCDLDILEDYSMCGITTKEELNKFLRKMKPEIPIIDHMKKWREQKKPRTCGECEAENRHDIELSWGTLTLCGDHPKVKATPGMYKRVLPCLEACPNGIKSQE